VQNTFLEDIATQLRDGVEGKIKKISEKKDEALDLLMAQYADLQYTKNDDYEDKKTSRKSKAKKLSKKEKALYKKIKKL